MALTKIMVVYSVAQSLRRHVIVCDDDNQYDAHLSSLLPGEAIFWLPIENYRTTQLEDGTWVPDMSIDAELAYYLNKPPESDRCAIINGDGEVKAVVCADPRIDDHPDGFLIQQVAVQTGDFYDFTTDTVIPQETVTDYTDG